ncbi:MAG TPA: HAMP domain-containing sensor histidine kinase [Dermatophilaceae bacterium]|nr:HAMP domain-containing sensor histidine kinase [Dermatophilaceae bacterium]
MVRLSLRVRLLLIGLAGVGAALAIGSVVLYAVLTVTVNLTVERAAWATAQDVVALAQQGPLAEPLPVSGIHIVQVVDALDRVVGASANADRLVPMLRESELTRAAAQQSYLTVPGSRAAVSGPLRVCAIPVGDGRTVIVAAQVGEVQRGQELLRTSLLVSYPLLLAALGLIAWWVIGRTLRPVEQLRAGAERISGAGHDERLPTPRPGDEIHALSVTLNRMLDRLAAARARQRAFVADAAHELRSPVASIRTQLEVAQQLGEGGDLPAEILLDVHRLEALVEDLLLLARSGADGRPLSAREAVDVRALAAEVTGRYAAARVPVTLSPGPVVYASANREEARRALANLVDNAVRHAESSVSVDVEPDGTQAVLAVTDDGPGIAAPDRERVFERFTRLDDDRSREGGGNGQHHEHGSGLGLAIVRELASRGGGTVRLLDRPDRAPGLRAELRLPR